MPEKKPTEVWLCPYDARDLLVNARQGVITRQCPKCGLLWSQGGAPLHGHRLNAVYTLEER
jgi:hypothetical protein